MTLFMSGLDYNLAEVGLREQLSFSAAQVEALDGAIAGLPGVSGAVLLSTCNRTELYVTVEEAAELVPGQLLCQAAGKDWGQFAAAFVNRDGEEAVRHLLEVASGLRSQIWGEDQIVTQVGRAMEIARKAGSINSVLSTLFHTAVAAAKDVKTHVRFTAIPSSAATEAVELLDERLNGLAGKRAVVIGNGEMGKLSARLLRSAGCQVTVTLRTYRHGETVVPFGCGTIPYDRRLEAIDGADVLFSATTSPHYTFTLEQARTLKHCPTYLVDLAIPRDIDPEAGALAGITLYNVDDFGINPQSTDAGALAQAEQLVEKHLREFRGWWDYRNCIPVMGELKAALGRRFAAEGIENYQPIVDRTVELMLGGLKGCVTSDALRECAAKIDAFTRPRRRTGLEEEHI